MSFSYQEKNLLITGGCGFIGSNFINQYFYNDTQFNKIVNIDIMYYCASLNNIETEIKENKKYVFVMGNICDKSLIKNILETFQITHIIHFAAQSHVQNSFENSINFTVDNIVGTHNLLECSRIYGKIQKFIHVSTDEVYGESMLDIEEKQKCENSILCPKNPYASTKAGAELIAQAYYHSFKLPVIITRSNNIYGKNQYPEKIIPLFIKLLKENKKLTIHGDGTNVRAFLHVTDVCNAFQLILEKGIIGEIYNIGCDTQMEYSILDISKMLIKLMKQQDNYTDYIEFVEDRPFNDKRYYISNDKIKSLGWVIKKNFLEGIQELIDTD
jgi:dTDP-glucose 4,6-dehydratase